MNAPKPKGLIKLIYIFAGGVILLGLLIVGVYFSPNAVKILYGMVSVHETEQAFPQTIICSCICIYAVSTAGR